MKFSVLMSIYAREVPEYLRGCLNSLCGQTVPAAEVVLVFDGALTPELEAVVGDFQAALPLKTVRLSENVGLGRALNEGLRHCTHEWVFRMDSDDLCLPRRFELQCAYIAAHPAVVLLGGQIAESDKLPESDLPLPTDATGLPEYAATRVVPTAAADIRRFAEQRNPFNHMTVAYRKNAVLAAGGYRHHLWMEDYNLWLRMLACGAAAANLADVLVLARTGAGMLERRRGLRYAASEWRLLRLKRALHFQAALPALYCFILRALPRLLPASCLKKIYQILRKP